MEHLIVESIGPVMTVVINRPRVLNALNAATLRELDAVISRAAEDRGTRIVIITGAGEKAFAAGADITELASSTPAELTRQARFGQSVFDRIDRLGKPVIAAINGFALGGGCELALACTIRLASENATIGQPEVNLGLLPGYGGSQRLPRLIGRGRAVEMLLTGEPLTARQALEYGLVTRVVPQADLIAEARRLAARLADKSASAMRFILDAVADGLDRPLAGALQHEAKAFGRAGNTDDMREGTRAFLEKRPAVFKGR